MQLYSFISNILNNFDINLFKNNGWFLSFARFVVHIVLLLKVNNGGSDCAVWRRKFEWCEWLFLMLKV